MSGCQFWEKPDLKMAENHIKISREQMVKSRQLLEKNAEVLKQAGKALAASNLLLGREFPNKGKLAG